MVEIKICGLTNWDDAMRGVELGADYLGFVLYAGSPRYIRAMKLIRLLDRLQGDWKAVAVCVNEAPATLASVARDCRLHAVQICGDEPPDGFKDFAIPVWRAVRLKDSSFRPEPAAWPAERYVVDASVPGQYGGTGVTADWEKAKAFAAEHRAMLAGGLTPDNVAEAIRAVRPLGVDVASGVEVAPGRKDPGKLKLFVQRAREAGAREAGARRPEEGEATT